MSMANRPSAATARTPAIAAQTPPPKSRIDSSSARTPTANDAARQPDRGARLRDRAPADFRGTGRCGSFRVLPRSPRKRTARPVADRGGCLRIFAPQAIARGLRAIDRPAQAGDCRNRARAWTLVARRRAGAQAPGVGVARGVEGATLGAAPARNGSGPAGLAMDASW